MHRYFRTALAAGALAIVLSVSVQRGSVLQRRHEIARRAHPIPISVKSVTKSSRDSAMWRPSIVGAAARNSLSKLHLWAPRRAIKGEFLTWVISIPSSMSEELALLVSGAVGAAVLLYAKQRQRLRTAWVASETWEAKRGKWNNACVNVSFLSAVPRHPTIPQLHCSQPATHNRCPSRSGLPRHHRL